MHPQTFTVLETIGETFEVRIQGVLSIDGFWSIQNRPESSRIRPHSTTLEGREIASFDGHFPRVRRGKCPSKLAISGPPTASNGGGFWMGFWTILDDSGYTQNPSIVLSHPKGGVVQKYLETAPKGLTTAMTNSLS